MLDIEPVGTNDKLLFRFMLDFEHPAELGSIFGRNYLFSRSVLENLFIKGNATHIRVESSCGTINPVFLKE